ncbi:MAG: type II toxin-antitoxin system HigB family toxin [Saprospiraceae bacterium]
MREFWEIATDTEEQLLGWYFEMEKGKFRTTSDLLNAFPNSRSIGSNRYVFKIKGNQYRLIVKINFDLQAVWVRFIGTHAEYDEIDSLSI